MGWWSGEGGSGICSGDSSLTGVVSGADTSSRTGSLWVSGSVLKSDSALNNGLVFASGSVLNGGWALNRNCFLGSGSVLNNVVFAGDGFSHGGLFLNCGWV